MAHQLGIHVGPTHQHPRHGAAIAVGVLHLEHYLLAEHQRTEHLLRPAAIRLPRLRRIDLRQARPDLLPVGRQAGERIPITDSDDAAVDHAGECQWRGEGEQEGGQDGEA